MRQQPIDTPLTPPLRDMRINSVGREGLGREAKVKGEDERNWWAR